MSVTINPVFPVVAAQPVAAVALQPGTVINAQVLQQLDSNLVRIAIANLTLEVLTEVPLQSGQALQLAVSRPASDRVAKWRCVRDCGGWRSAGR